MSFADDYAEQLKKGVEAFCEKVFPQEALDALEIKARADIAAGLNICNGEPIFKFHADRITTGLLYPAIKWCCDECGQALFEMGKVGSGALIFDMTPPSASTEGTIEGADFDR